MLISHADQDHAVAEKRWSRQCPFTEPLVLGASHAVTVNGGAGDVEFLVINGTGQSEDRRNDNSCALAVTVFGQSY